MAEKKKATSKAAATKADKPAEKKVSKAAPKEEAKKATSKKEVKAKEEEKKVSKTSPKEETKKAAAKENSKKSAPKDEAKKASAKGDSKKNSKDADKPTAKANTKKPKDDKTVDVEPAETPVETTKTTKGGKKPAPAPVVEPEPAAVETVTVVEIDAEQYSPVLLRGVKKLRSAFFTEVNEQEERANKKKVSSDVKAAEKPTIALRHKASLAEETPEELHARVIRELEEANRIFEAEIANQVCTRCCINPVVAEFRVDKDLGYCEECAAILKLGQSKEARQTEYNMSFGRGDDDDEDEDEDFEDGPTAEDLEEAEEDLEED